MHRSHGTSQVTRSRDRRSGELAEEGALRPVARPRLYEELVQRLLEYVTQAGLTTGDRLPTERNLAERLGVSRASVRQAIVVLDVQGLVEVRQGDGTYLRRTRESLTPWNELLDRKRRLPEILEAREALEVKLAELAALRRSTEDLAVIDDALDRMANEIESGRIGADADRNFHAAIAAAAKNSILTRLIESLADSIHETRMESLSQPGRPKRSLAAHQRIATAIRREDPRGAARAMRDHLKVVADVRLLHWQPEE
jgi:GntR family transcriptional repressor for pyruvate dehydrogenase complex